MSQSVDLDIFGKASVPWNFSSIQKILEKIQAKKITFISLWLNNAKPDSELNLVSSHCSPENPVEIIKNSFVPGHYLTIEVMSVLDEMLNQFLKTLSNEVVGEFSFISTFISFGEHVVSSTDMDGDITTRSPSTLSFSILGGFDTPLWTSEYDKAITSKEVAELLHPFVAPFYSEYAILPSYSW